MKLGEAYQDLFAEASAYAKRKFQAEQQALIPANNTRQWILIGGAAVTGIALLYLVLGRKGKDETLQG